MLKLVVYKWFGSLMYTTQDHFTYLILYKEILRNLHSTVGV